MSRRREDLENKYRFLIEVEYYKEHYTFESYICFVYIDNNYFPSHEARIKLPDCDITEYKDKDIYLNKEIEYEYEMDYRKVKEHINTPKWFQDLLEKIKKLYYNEVRFIRLYK
ncbi:hypothetical protein [Bacillus cereus]